MVHEDSEDTETLLSKGPDLILHLYVRFDSWLLFHISDHSYHFDEVIVSVVIQKYVGESTVLATQKQVLANITQATEIFHDHLILLAELKTNYFLLVPFRYDIFEWGVVLKDDLSEFLTESVSSGVVIKAEDDFKEEPKFFLNEFWLKIDIWMKNDFKESLSTLRVEFE